MVEETKNSLLQVTEDEQQESPTYDLTVSSPADLSVESKKILEQIILEKDEQKTQDLVQLFNANQDKKTMIRVDKLSNLLDTITDQALVRFTTRPDEISNKELFDGLKTVQDLIERGQKQVSNAGETPLIQFNQQTNEVNIGGNSNALSRDSRERVKTAVTSLLDSLITKQSNTATAVEESNIITVDTFEEIEEVNTNGGEQ